MKLSVVLVLCALVGCVVADVYMHNPRGSNDRNCERNVNRRNGNRLFDSQNNAKGGYACPRAVGGPNVVTPKFYYYAGSKLPIEWTAQHGCGTNEKEHCEIILQYACEDTLDPEQKFRGPGSLNDAHIGAPRDGTPRDSQDSATDTIPANVASATADTVETRRFGMQENIEYYDKCRYTERNKGLYTADQRVRRNDARGTRQNPNGNRNGLECPEERDYYPYWRPTPWIDIAVITDQPNRCNYYQTMSQNAATSKVGECAGPIPNNKRGSWYNNKAACEAAGQTWLEAPRYRFGLDMNSAAGVALAGKIQPVDCQAGKFGRINHLGNAVGSNYQDASDATAIPHGDNAYRYIWNVPNHLNDNCVLRIRYNISTADYAAWGEDGTAANYGRPGLNSTFNKDEAPVKQDPYVDINARPADGLIDEFLSLAINTNQYGRTFQDRSYVFSIKSRPSYVPTNAKVYNLNVRGKRGNIVQTYPAVEYDFVPNELNMQTGDYVHFQWTGSDYNPRRGCNNGEGGPPDPNVATAARQNSRADRSNLIEMNLMDTNIPQETLASKLEPSWTMFRNQDNTINRDLLRHMAFINQREYLPPGTECLTRDELDSIGNKNERENHPQNCAKLNAAFFPYFDGGIIRMNVTGTFPYFCSRNNNFSNRDQTGKICVGTCAASPAGKIADSLPLASESQAQEEDILTEETTPFNDKDNDSTGDGEAEGCEEMNFDTYAISSSSAVGLAFGMLFLGVFLTLAIQWGINKYLAYKKFGRSPFSCGGETDTEKLTKRPAKPAPPTRSKPLTTANVGGSRAPVSTWEGSKMPPKSAGAYAPAPSTAPGTEPASSPMTDLPPRGSVAATAAKFGARRAPAPPSH